MKRILIGVRGWYTFRSALAKGQPGVGMSADAARMSACATMDSNYVTLG
jgi:hypothetical protein